MANYPVNLPPGVARNGTEIRSKGRWFDAWGVRWTDDGTLKPIGGVRTRSSDVVTGKARSILAWQDNDETTWLGIGTHTGLFVQDRGGEVTDITPTGFTTGEADADAAGGYGDGDYGDGDYGTPRPDDEEVVLASQWTLDQWGENLVGVMAEDGTIYEWEPDVGSPAVAVTDAPACVALVVSAEEHLFALGTTTPRTVSWSDVRDNTEWTPGPTTQAGDKDLKTAGNLMCGKAMKGGVLFFTNLDVHLATWVGGNFVYSIDRIATGCGIISRQAVATIDTQAVWMGTANFWIFDGYVRPLPCDLQDYVFSDFNKLQASKTYAVRDSTNSEVLFYYCSAASNEIDRCVVWNSKQNYWNKGRVARTCGTDSGVFTYPIFVSSSGAIYEHEIGMDYDGNTPYADTVIQPGNGDQNFRVQKMIPDERTSGDCEVTFYGRYKPNGDEYTFGPYACLPEMDPRFEARQFRMRVSGAVLSDWRFGTAELDIHMTGKRG